VTGLGALGPATFLVCGTGLGWIAMRRAGSNPGRRLLWAAALSPALGFAPPGLLVLGFAVAGVRLPSRLVFAALLAALFLALALAFRGLAGDGEPRSPSPPAPSLDREPRALRAIALLILLAVAAPALEGVAAGLESWPEGTWDAVAIWNARARLLFRDAGAAGSVLARLDDDAHPGYPLLLPASLAASWKLLGYESRAASAAESVAWLAACVLVTALALSRPGRWSAGVLGGAALLALSPFVKWAPSQCTDLAVAYALLLAAVALAPRTAESRWPADPLPPALGGWALGLLALAKNEGLPLAAGLAFGWGIATFARRRRATQGWLPVALALAPFLAALGAQRLGLSPGQRRSVFLDGPWLDRLTDPARWSEVLDALWLRAVGGPEPHGWGPFWLVLLLLALLGLALPRDRAARAPAAFGLLAALSTALAAFLLTVIELRYHIGSALDRLLAQAAPLALVAAAAPLVAGGSLASPETSRSPLVRATARLRALVRRHALRSLAALLGVLLLVKLATVGGALGAMWSWPEELAVATAAFDLFAPLVRAPAGELSAPSLVSIAIGPVDLLGLEGAERYRALIAALNLALAGLLALATAASDRSSRPALAWALVLAFLLSGWALLADTLAGASFLLFLVALERAARQRDSPGSWLAFGAAGGICAASDPTLGLPLLLGGVAGLVACGPPTRYRARIAAAVALALPALVGWLGSGPTSLVRGAGAYLDLRSDVPLRLLAARGVAAVPDWTAAFLREIGYFHVGTLGWAFAGLSAIALSRGSRSLRRPFLVLCVTLLVAVAARSVWASAALAAVPSGLSAPRFVVTGRALDFTLPAGLWLGARALSSVRRRGSTAAAAICAIVAGGGTALFFATLPTSFVEQALRHRAVPLQTALGGLARLARLDDGAPWAIAGALALGGWLATARLSRRRRAPARALAAGIAASLLAATGLVALGEVSFESRGSLLFHSRAVELVRTAHDQGRLEAVAVDVRVLRFRPESAVDLFRWKDSLRVIADLPELALAARPAPGTCAAVLTTSRLPDREIIAAFYADTLFLWGPRSGFECEPAPAQPRPAKPRR